MKLAAAAAASLLPLALGCSYVELPYPSANGTSYLIGRTMEEGNILGRLSHSIETVPAKSSGGKYGYLGLMTKLNIPINGTNAALDGMNEVGFTASALELDQSEYQAKEAGVPNVLVEDVVGTLLAHCGSVGEALGYLEGVRVVTGSPFERKVYLLHFALADASGRSVVVEYLEGKMVVYDNTPRVMTNDPDLKWQWRNLNTYSNLSPKYPTENSFLEVEVDGVGSVPKAVGNGWNLHGLPGDSSPPSRYVRLFYLRGYALHQQAMKDLNDAIVLGTALLNNVYIPYGTVPANPFRGAAEGFDRPDFTPYGILKSPAERKLLVRGYRNSQWRQLDLGRLDFQQQHIWPVEDGTLGIEDITAKPSVI